MQPKPGSLIAALRKIIKEDLPSLLDDPATPWKTLDVTYEQPRVERVWIQVREYRVNLHRIHPCTRALQHPHPAEGSAYEMTHRHGWHYVMPLEKPSMSIMLTGTPWPADGLITHPGKKQNEPLGHQAKHEILEFFRERLL